MDLPLLWKQYKQEKSLEAKKQLITHYAPQVKFVAERMAINLPSHIEVADLINDGIIGLMDAIEKFDMEKGFKFETYAGSRIHGAILDSLRALDWVPRNVRRKAREIEAVFQKRRHGHRRQCLRDQRRGRGGRGYVQAKSRRTGAEASGLRKVICGRGRRSGLHGLWSYSSFSAGPQKGRLYHRADGLYRTQRGFCIADPGLHE